MELPRDGRRDALLAELAGSPYRAKMRTGGVRPELYPDERELAGSVLAAVRETFHSFGTCSITEPVAGRD